MVTAVMSDNVTTGPGGRRCHLLSLLDERKTRTEARSAHGSRSKAGEVTASVYTCVKWGWYQYCRPHRAALRIEQGHWWKLPGSINLSDCCQKTKTNKKTNITNKKTLNFIPRKARVEMNKDEGVNDVQAWVLKFLNTFDRIF